MPSEQGNASHVTFCRRQLRLKCRGIAQIKPALAEQASMGWLLDLSLGGCCIEWEHAGQCVVGTEVEVRLEVRGSILCVIGVVRYVRRGKIMGVEFGRLSARKQEQVEEMLADFLDMLRFAAAGRAAKPSRGKP